MRSCDIARIAPGHPQGMHKKEPAMAFIPSLQAQVGMSFAMPDFLVWIGIAWLALTQLILLILIIQVTIRLLKTRREMRRDNPQDPPASEPDGSK